MQRVHKNPAKKKKKKKGEFDSYNSHTLFLPRLPLSMPSFPTIPSPLAISFSQFQTENNVVGKEATNKSNNINQNNTVNVVRYFILFNSSFFISYRGI